MAQHGLKRENISTVLNAHFSKCMTEGMWATPDISNISHLSVFTNPYLHLALRDWSIIDIDE